MKESYLANQLKRLLILLTAKALHCSFLYTEDWGRIATAQEADKQLVAAWELEGNPILNMSTALSKEKC